jgi:hypothetical protein
VTGGGPRTGRQCAPLLMPGDMHILTLSFRGHGHMRERAFLGSAVNWTFLSRIKPVKVMDLKERGFSGQFWGRSLFRLPQRELAEKLLERCKLQSQSSGMGQQPSDVSDVRYCCRSQKRVGYLCRCHTEPARTAQLFGEPHSLSEQKNSICKAMHVTKACGCRGVRHSRAARRQGAAWARQNA